MSPAQRLAAVGRQLTSGPDPAPASTPASAPAPPALPAVREIAPPSITPRAAGKVVVITGANSPLGIGRAAAHQFASAGAAAVYVCDAVDSHLPALEREMRARWPAVAVHARCFDAADEAAVRAVVDDAVTRYGRLDVFFANAGTIGPPTAFADVTADAFMQVMRVNALGPFLAAKYAAPAMQRPAPGKSPQTAGSIVLTASVAGLRSNAGPTPYSASKAAVISLAQTLAFQMAGTGVRVNAVCPGLIETGMTAPTFERARERGTADRIGQLNPSGRAGCSDEIARVVLFLASDEASYVNGQAWAVDGGLSAGHPFVRGKLA